MVNKAVKKKKKDQPSILFPFAKEVKINTFNQETTAEGDNILLAIVLQKPPIIS